MGSDVRKRCAAAVMAIVLLGWGVASSAPDKRAELKALKALVKESEAQCKWPPKGSVTKYQKDNYVESMEYRMAWFTWMEQLIRAEPTVHPELVAYWVARSEDSSTVDGGFAEKALALVSGTPGLSAWSDSLRAAGESLFDADRKHAGFAYEYFDQHKAIEASYKSNGIWEKRQALLKVVEKILSSASDPGRDRDASRKALSEFLIRDMHEQRGRIEKDHAKLREISPSMRSVYWDATKSPASNPAFFEQIETLYRSLEASRITLYEQALAPGKTPMEFLEKHSREFIDLQARFDRELVRYLGSPAVKDASRGIVTADALYGVEDCLERRKDILESGRWTQSLHLLANAIGRSHYLGGARARYDIFRDPDTGTYLTGPIQEQVGRNVDLINRYRERWVGNGKPPGRLFAAVEVDGRGRSVWKPGGWLLWEWITSEDLEDLSVDGRVVEALGRRWLLPAGGATASIGNLRDIQAANAREIIVAIDPGGAWARGGN